MPYHPESYTVIMSRNHALASSLFAVCLAGTTATSCATLQDSTKVSQEIVVNSERLEIALINYGIGDIAQNTTGVANWLGLDAEQILIDTQQFIKEQSVPQELQESKATVLKIIDQAIEQDGPPGCTLEDGSVIQLTERYGGMSIDGGVSWLASGFNADASFSVYANEVSAITDDNIVVYSTKLDTLNELEVFVEENGLDRADEFVFLQEMRDEQVKILQLFAEAETGRCF